MEYVPPVVVFFTAIAARTSNLSSKTETGFSEMPSFFSFGTGKRMPARGNEVLPEASTAGIRNSSFGLFELICHPCSIFTWRATVKFAPALTVHFCLFRLNETRLDWACTKIQDPKIVQTNTADRKTLFIMTPSFYKLNSSKYHISL